MLTLSFITASLAAAPLPLPPPLPVTVPAAVLCALPPVAGQRAHAVVGPDEIPRNQADYLVAEVTTQARVYEAQDGRELYLDNGLVRRTFRLTPDAATVAFDDLTTGQSLLRAIRPEASVMLNSIDLAVGGLTGQPNHAFLLPEWLEEMESDPGRFHYLSHEVGETTARMQWKQVRHHAPGATWPPPGVHLRFDYGAPTWAPDGVALSVHYELYDGVPVLSKWIEIVNNSDESWRIGGFTAERLAIVEEESWVELGEGVSYPTPSALHVETDFSFGGMTPLNASGAAVQWQPDPEYSSQVNYQRATPCLLEVSPRLGPEHELAPGGTFESFRVFELVHDSSDRERRGLALRRMYRTIAPWVTENPLMHHMRVSDADAVRGAIEQAAQVGFEMLILSFGSGFDIESEDPDDIALWKELADHASEHGIELGGYSLLASRSIGPDDDVVMQSGKTPRFGHSPCLGSVWGERYFEKLYAFFEATGFALLEHDGNYPGDPCASEVHPGHNSHYDSVWNQWRTITDFYRWCRGRGIYLNVPDYYYLAGSNKNGMGYREVNWSLPRAEQVLHTRQNIYDGTWTKTPSMGWMFVPLSEYQGGGAAATIEPLDEHREHYQRMLESNLAMGVQACYRGPRVFDTEATRAMLTRQVAWFKEHREILESDVLHGRRADGRDVDWMLHVNPFPSDADGTRGMLVAFNPLADAVTRTLELDLYYTGLSERVSVSVDGASATGHDLDRDYRIQLQLTIPGGGMTWAALR